MRNNKPLRTAVLFGGQSPEHEISLKSALYILTNIDRKKHNIDPIYILPDGRECQDDELRKQHIGDAYRKGIIPREWGESWDELTKPVHGDKDFFRLLRKGEYDLVMPLFHGPFGEDGTIQGLLEFLGVPYTGCDLTGCAVTIDKDLTKRICRDHGIPVVPFKRVLKSEWDYQQELTLKELLRDFQFPLFVKPARQGSSFGITKADNKTQLLQSIDNAFIYDNKIIIEKCINGIEYAVGILGNEFPEASLPAEFKLSTDFFDFEAKYGADAIDDVIPAPVSYETTERLQQFALRVFRSLELRGLARVDCFIENGHIYLNEVNSLPGLGGHSVFNRNWEASGVQPTELISRIVDLALEKKNDFRTAVRQWQIEREQ